jgi:hypothetical protein
MLKLIAYDSVELSAAPMYRLVREQKMGLGFKKHGR